MPSNNNSHNYDDKSVGFCNESMLGVRLQEHGLIDIIALYKHSIYDVDCRVDVCVSHSQHNMTTTSMLIIINVSPR